MIPPLPVAGWHEAVALPDLGLERVFAKLDTGADRSCVHARDLLVSADQSYVEFSAPLLRVQRDCSAFDVSGGGIRRIRAEIADIRIVRSSNGSEELRPVITSTLSLGEKSFRAHLSLRNREGMRFCVLLGRDTLAHRFLIDASRAHLLETPFDGTSPA